MAIHVTCDACGKTLKTKDALAGRRAKCPACGEVIQIPDAEAAEFEDVYDAEETPFGDLGEPDDWGETTDEESLSGRKPCPMCGEMIKENAAKCRYCGEIFDPELKKRAKKDKTDVDADMTTGDWVIAILCSGIGCIAGIIWMIQGKPKGKKMFFVSLGVQLFWGAVRVAIEVAQQ